VSILARKVEKQKREEIQRIVFYSHNKNRDVFIFFGGALVGFVYFI
jgi:hypothetical protein